MMAAKKKYAGTPVQKTFRKHRAKQTRSEKIADVKRAQRSLVSLEKRQGPSRKSKAYPTGRPARKGTHKAMEFVGNVPVKFKQRNPLKGRKMGRGPK